MFAYKRESYCEEEWTDKHRVLDHLTDHKGKKNPGHSISKVSFQTQSRRLVYAPKMSLSVLVEANHSELEFYCSPGLAECRLWRNL